MNEKITEIINSVLGDFLKITGFLGLICGLSLLVPIEISFFILMATLIFLSFKLVTLSNQLKDIQSSLNGKIQVSEKDFINCCNDITKNSYITKSQDIIENIEIEAKDIENKELTPESLKLNIVKSDDLENLKEDIKDDIIEKSNSNIDKNNELIISLSDEELKKCIRKLGGNRKASKKAKELARQYGYELKEGETFVMPKKKQ